MKACLKAPLAPELLRSAEQIVDRAGVLDDEVARNLVYAFAGVPFSSFFPALSGGSLPHEAISLGFGQSSLTPHFLARVLGLVGVRKGVRLLIVGAGSGYSSAIAAAAGCSVFSVEIIAPLAHRARRALDASGFQNVILRTGDGMRGWRDHAPFDGVVLTTPCLDFAPELLQSVGVHGVLIGVRSSSPHAGPEVGEGPSVTAGQVLTLVERRAADYRSYPLEVGSFIGGAVR